MNWEKEIIKIIRADEYDHEDVGHNEITLKVCNFIREHLLRDSESVPAETQVSFAEPKRCINCKYLSHEIDDGYPFDYCNYFDITITDMTKHFCAKHEVMSN